MRLALAAAVVMLSTGIEPGMAAGNGPSLCDKGETTIFSCPIRSRTVSLCVSPDIGPDKGSMTYRFGKRGAIELAYPEPGVKPSKAFTRGSVERGDYVHFNHSGTSYKLYSIIEKDYEAHGGVQISENGKKSVDLKCDHGADGLGPDNWALMYKADLSQDADGDLD